MDSGLHDEALQRLCFVCRDIITKGKLYDVDFYLEMLCKGLKCVPQLVQSPVLRRRVFVLNVIPQYKVLRPVRPPELEE